MFPKKLNFKEDEKTQKISCPKNGCKELIDSYSNILSLANENKDQFKKGNLKEVRHLLNKGNFHEVFLISFIEFIFQI